MAALPSQPASVALGDAAPEASAGLGELEAASGAVVTFGFRSSELVSRLDGTGFLVPFSEPGAMRGATFSSSKWAARAPEGHALVRVFLREGLANPEQTALAELGTLFDLPKPCLTSCRRWTGGLPLYKVGHVQKIERIEAELAGLPGVVLAGQAYRGVGIPDCIRQGHDAAVKLANSL